MCYNCACHIPQDDMGNPDNITEKTFEKAAKAWGQSLLEAKRNTYNLLAEELRRADAKIQPKKTQSETPS